MAQALYFSLLVIALCSISECIRLNYICDNAVPSEKNVVTCESQTATLSCDQGTIKVLSANYGRTDRQTCSIGRPDDQISNVQCTQSTSLSVVALRCDGKTSCSIVAENTAFTDPCGGTYKYLTVSYECVVPPPPSPVEPSLVVVTCESQTAFLSCVQGVIKVLSANYGRTDRQTCSTGRPDNQLTNVQCTQSTSLSVVAIRCDGKTICSIVAENAAFTDPCGGTYKYLTVSYKCVAPPPPSPVVPSEKAVVTCESQTASLSCDQGTIKVLSANYGRTDRQTCSTGRPDNQLTNVQCTLSTSLSVVAIRCDGKTSCSIVAENAAFSDPCGGTYKYLTVSYKCVAPPPPSPVVPSEKAVVTCESQTASLSCDQGTIKVLSANYGRTDRQTCSSGRPDNQLTNVQCTQSTSLSVVAIRCDGKTSCSIVAENAAFTDPCGGTYKYLTVSYECVAPPPPSPVVPSEKAVVTCESQTASLSCDQGTIKVLSANYGRTDRQTCSSGRPDNQLTNVQCTQSTSLNVVAIRCDGKTSCSIVAENAAFTDPCGGTYKYLTVSYKCVAPPPPSPVVPSGKAVVTCESQTASLSCDQGTIKVLSANYGRTDRQTCSSGRPDNQLTNVQCTQSTSLSVVAIRCDGKTSCSIVAENAAFTDPCGGTYKYLTVSYECIAPPPPSPVVPSGKAVVTCESQTASLSCDQGTIKVLSANYGRTDRQTCSSGRPDNQLTNVQCTQSTSLSVVAIRCDGKTSCSIVAENAAFTDPCGGTYKYLTVSYECIAPPPPSPVVPSEKAVVTCESQTASLSCDQGTIKVLSANYGRTDRQTCSTGRPDNQLTNVQCTLSTSLSVVAIRCDGKTSCSIVVENAAFTDPCGGTYKYLTVSYKCVAPPPPSPVLVVPSGKAVVTCESQTASLSCDQGTIKVLSANYGRTDRQTCSSGRPDNQLTNVQCTQSTSLSVVAIRCDGKTSCSIVAENAAFTDPCGGTYKYLTVSYECIAPPPPSPVVPSGKAVVTCESQTASLSCDQGTIKVLSANYGRTDRQTCSSGRPDNQLTNVQCTQSTSLSVVAIRCDGKTSCSIVAENAAFTDPCGGTYKYLTVSYECIAPPPPSPVVPSEKAMVTCESQTASLSCDQGTIKVLSANYGRTDRQTCSTGRPDNQLTNVQCTQSTSLSVVAIRCDGKTSCSIVAENAAFTDPCGGTYKYLTVSYKCVAPPPPSPEKAVVTCESQTASLSCDQGTIKVLSANYGRTDRQTCSTGRPNNQLTNVQCTQSTSINVVAVRCDGKTSCSIVADNAAFTDPCGGTYKYLTVSYKCISAL